MYGRKLLAGVRRICDSPTPISWSWLDAEITLVSNLEYRSVGQIRILRGPADVEVSGWHLGLSENSLSCTHRADNANMCSTSCPSSETP
jgi:hypothetical protein